jgi:hypothetical protein
MEAVGTVTNNKGTAVLFSRGSGTRTVTLRGLVKEYLLEKQLTYGRSVDTYDLLKEVGISETASLLRDGREYMRYVALAKKVADEMVEHLTMFGFKADKKKKARAEGFDGTRHINGNVVYTNYQWTVAGKAGAAVLESLNSMVGIHDEGIDMSHWRATRPNEYNKWRAIADEKHRFGTEEMTEWAKDVFEPAYKELMESINGEDLEERIAIAKTMQPVNYGRYIDE